MSSGILLFIVLAVTGGLIAFAGDNIGRKIGRKHWRIFSLRPKHTGTIVTTACGIVMIGAVMSVLYFFDGDFRAAVNDEATVWRNKFAVASSQFERERLTRSRQGAELQRLAARNEALRSEQVQVQEQLRLTQVNLVLRQKGLQHAQKLLEARQARLADLNRQEQAMRTRIAALNRENQQLRQEGRQLLVSQRTLNREITRLAWKVHSTRNAALAARAGEVLVNAEAAGSQSGPRAQQLVAKALSYLDKPAAGRTGRAPVAIPSGDVQAAVKALQQPGQYVIRITAGNNARPGEPLNVRLVVVPLQQPSVDIASDILERDRLKGVVPQERLSHRPSVADPGTSLALSSEDRQSLLDVIQQLSKANTTGSVQSRVLNDPSLGGPLHLRLDTSNSPE